MIRDETQIRDGKVTRGQVIQGLIGHIRVLDFILNDEGLGQP